MEVARAAAAHGGIYASHIRGEGMEVVQSVREAIAIGERAGMPVEIFLKLLGQNKFVGGWQFSAPHVRVDAGDSLTVKNRGGETHTFTEVSQFGGGGIIPPLNEIMFGTPNPPLFFDPNNLTFIPAGGKETITPTPGTHLFICAIHPWMEDTVVVR